MIDQGLSSADLAGILTKICAEEIFFDSDLALEVRNGSRGSLDQLLRLFDFQKRGCAATFKSLSELEQLLSGGEGSQRNFKFKIEFSQLEIGSGYIGNEGGQHRLLIRLSGDAGGEVFFQGGSDQFLKFFVLENRPPFLVA